MSSNKAKLAEFRSEIRRQYINEILKKKRKQLINSTLRMPILNQQQKNLKQKNLDESVQQIISHKQQCQSNTSELSLAQITMLCQFSNTQYGTSVLLKTHLPVQLLYFLSPPFYGTQQQMFTTAIFANFTFVKSQVMPGRQFLRNLTNIIENLSYFQNQQHQIDTLESCLIIIYNLMTDFQHVIQFYLNQKEQSNSNNCTLINLLYGIFDCIVTESIAQKGFKILYQLSKYLKQRKNPLVLRRFLKFFISILQNSNHSSLFFLSLSNISSLLVSSTPLTPSQLSTFPAHRYHLSPPFLQQILQTNLLSIQQQIENSRVFQKLVTYFKVVWADRVIVQEIFILIHNVVKGIKIQTITNRLLKLLNRIYDLTITSYNQTTINHYNQPTINQYNQHQNYHQNSNQILIIQKTTQPKIQLNHNKTNAIKYHFYQIIYQILITFNEHHSLLVKNQLFPKLFTNFQNIYSENSNVQKSILYIVGILFFSNNLPLRCAHDLFHFIDKQQNINININTNQSTPIDASFQNFLQQLQKQRKQNQILKSYIQQN